MRRVKRRRNNMISKLEKKITHRLKVFLY